MKSDDVSSMPLAGNRPAAACTSNSCCQEAPADLTCPDPVATRTVEVDRPIAGEAELVAGAKSHKPPLVRRPASHRILRPPRDSGEQADIRKEIALKPSFSFARSGIRQ